MNEEIGVWKVNCQVMGTIILRQLLKSLKIIINDIGGTPYIFKNSLVPSLRYFNNI